jgi:hypothetical protein
MVAGMTQSQQLLPQQVVEQKQQLQLCACLPAHQGMGGASLYD